MSAIEEQLKKIKEEAVARAAKRASVSSRFDIEKERLEKLAAELTSLKAVAEKVAAFDFSKEPIASILEIILAGAIANRASDIHFESEEKAVRIRYRIDGRLQDIVRDFSLNFYSALLSRVKLLSHLKLDVEDRPQNGRFTAGLGAKNIELRVSVVPAEFGETMVIRVLDPDTIDIPLDSLGLRRDDLEIVQKEISEPNGMILNTGPTGSGKTTTLYSFLKRRQAPEIKIITIEDPIEYNLEGVEQTQIKPESGYTFANGLSSIMRQDPDVILVGEIRDEETAGIAVQAALTGHLVFSTVHANDAAGAIPRLLDLKVKATSVGPALNLIMAQRLVRRLCLKCRKETVVDESKKQQLKAWLEKLPERVSRQNYQEFKLYEPVGCSDCNQSGYKGRIGIFELLRVGKEIETLIEREASQTELFDFAIKEGMVTLQQDGILKALTGITSFKEVEAVTGSLKI